MKNVWTTSAAAFAVAAALASPSQASPQVSIVPVEGNSVQVDVYSRGKKLTPEPIRVSCDNLREYGRKGSVAMVMGYVLSMPESGTSLRLVSSVASHVNRAFGICRIP